MFIHDFDEESHAALVYNCVFSGVTVITNYNNKQPVDYMISPIDILSMDGITVRARNTVNHRWLVSSRGLNVLAIKIENNFAIFPGSFQPNAKKLNKPTDIPYYYKSIVFFQDASYRWLDLL